MTADVRPVAVQRAPSLPARLIGFGSIFGKTIRDGRRPALGIGLLASLMMFVTAAALVAEWPTAAERFELIASMQLLPEFVRGLLGDPIRIDTLGGFMSWRIGNLLPVIIGVWPVLALSATLAGEARRGSLDLVATTPVGRTRIALEKVVALVTLVVLALAFAAVVTWIIGATLATIPGDEIAFSDAVGHMVLTGLLMLAPASLAFAVAPVLGRGRAAGIGFLALFGGYLIASYRTLSDLIGALEPLSWYVWTAGHRPLAGQTDWPSVGLLAVVTVVFLVIGIVGFRRRDIGSAIALPGIGIGLPAGTGGPFRRRLADSAGISVAAGLGIGSYGALIAGSAEQFAEGIGQMAGLDEMIGSVFPGVDISQPTGLLQLAFFGFGALLISMAAAGFVGGLTSDETNNRLDQILASPIGRGPWFVRSGLGALASVVVTAVVIVLLVGGVVAATGGDVVGPIAAGVVIALYGASFVGIGLAIAGVWRPGIAAVATAAVAFSVYLLGTLGSALQLPDWLVDLSLIRHVGQPLVGDYDAVGMAVMAALAVGGLAIGAWGFRRRDVNR